MTRLTRTTTIGVSLTTLLLSSATTTVVMLSGCTQDRPSPKAASPASPSPLRLPDVQSAVPVPPDPSAGPVDAAIVTPVPEAAASSQESALTAATAVLTAFARPELSYPVWIAGLYPRLTQAGAAAYEDTDPATIPVHQITGEGRVHAGSTDLALIVLLPTDAGLYGVSLSRPSISAPWLADRIRPAQD